MDRIRQLHAVGGSKLAPKCERCGKLLVFTDKETSPNCRRCSIILRIEMAAKDLSDASNDAHENIIKNHLQK